ncbi:esterase family protein [Chitinophaga parva]|uniref:esterase family protein n=1 Tax=Chitinophaga parva TaxID=2169414 RepID=UPI001F0CD436|nr:alpha/beta hydrolase-fold protein [Chitinophaga parva]
MPVIENYIQWYAPSLDRQIDVLVYGDRGHPLILFPTSMGKYYESKDNGLIDAIAWFIDNGLVKVYCPDSVDAWSWYNKQVPPAERAHNHTRYNAMLHNELLPRIRGESGYDRIAVAGCSFGGYQAANFAFRYPGAVSYLFSLSGVFDVRFRLDGYYDDNVFYNNPVDFVPGDNDPALWQMGIILGTGEYDICLAENENFSRILSTKHIQHWLDIRPQARHDWPLWKAQLPHYLSLM